MKTKFGFGGGGGMMRDFLPILINGNGSICAVAKESFWSGQQILTDLVAQVHDK